MPFPPLAPFPPTFTICVYTKMYPPTNLCVHTHRATPHHKANACTPGTQHLSRPHTHKHSKMHDTIGHVRVSFWPLLRQCLVCCAILATYTCLIGCVLGWQWLIASLNSWSLVQKNRTKTGHLCRKKNLGSLTIVATPYLPILSLKLTRYTTQFSSSLPTAGRKYVSFPAQCYV